MHYNANIMQRQLDLRPIVLGDIHWNQCKMHKNIQKLMEYTDMQLFNAKMEDA